MKGGGEKGNKISRLFSFTNHIPIIKKRNLGVIVGTLVMLHYYFSMFVFINVYLS